MDAGLLAKLFGNAQQWQGPCTIVLDAEATVQTAGTDALGAAGQKNWAPRTVSGRMLADSPCLLPAGSGPGMVHAQANKTAPGEETIKQTLTIADAKHVVAIEFSETAGMVLQSLGLALPVSKAKESQSGTFTKPKSVTS